MMVYYTGKQNLCENYSTLWIALNLFISIFSQDVFSRRLSALSLDECYLVLGILDGISV